MLNTTRGIATCAVPTDDARLTCTVPQFRLISGLGESTIWALIAEGKLQAISVGGRRLIVLDSYRRLIREQLAAGPGDCRRNDRVPALGSGKRLNRNTNPIDPKTGKRRCGGPRKSDPAPDAAAK